METLSSVRIGTHVFDHVDYDDEGDVLYLSIGPPQPAEGEETPEGHSVRFVPGTTQVVGLTILNAKWLVERQGRLVVTMPERVEVPPEDLAVLMQPA